jgi:hypothetical protein
MLPCAVTLGPARAAQRSLKHFVLELVHAPAAVPAPHESQILAFRPKVQHRPPMVSADLHQRDTKRRQIFDKLTIGLREQLAGYLRAGMTTQRTRPLAVIVFFHHRFRHKPVQDRTPSPPVTRGSPTLDQHDDRLLVPRVGGAAVTWLCIVIDVVAAPAKRVLIPIGILLASGRADGGTRRARRDATTTLAALKGSLPRGARAPAAYQRERRQRRPVYARAS